MKKTVKSAVTKAASAMAEDRTMNAKERCAEAHAHILIH